MFRELKDFHRENPSEFYKELGGALLLTVGMYVLTVLVFCL